MEERNYTTGQLLRRFLPYYKNYWGIMIRDLCCAALTTVCELVLPLIMRYITNEATSALDNESEFAVAKSLAELSKGRTTLTIAHRLSTIRNADRILVLTDEGIVEEGNHDQLMELRGMYCHLYETANALK